MKILFHTPTETLKAYPRDDDEPVVGLSPEYQVLTLITDDRPAYDAVTHSITAVETVDLAAQTVTRMWQLTERVAFEAELIRDRRLAMAASFDSLPVAVQAAFWGTRIAAEAAMDRGRFDIARALVEAEEVPPELAAIKAAILSHL